jgi:protein phosphatase
MKLTIPELAVVALVGPSGSGKSSFARKHFRPTEVLSSDFCRGLVSDEENSQAATNDAFEVLYFIASKRLTTGKLVVIDATNVQAEARKPIIALAQQFHCIPVAIVFDLPEKLCHERNRSRPDRDFGPHVIRQQSQQLRRSLRNLQREGFRSVPWHSVSSPLASKHWSDSSGRNRFVAYMNVSLEYSPSKASRSIRVCSHSAPLFFR